MIPAGYRHRVSPVTEMNYYIVYSRKFSSVIPVLRFVPVGEAEQVSLGVKNETQSLWMKNKTPVFDSTFKFLQDFFFF